MKNSTSLRSKFDARDLLLGKLSDADADSKFDSGSLANRFEGRELLLGKAQARDLSAAPASTVSSAAPFAPLSDDASHSFANPSAPLDRASVSTFNFAKPQAGEFEVFAEHHSLSKGSPLQAPISAISGPVQGTISFAPSTIQEIPAVTVVSGLGAPGEQDVYQVDLVAGQTYMFSVRGTGADSLSDPLIGLFDPAQALIDVDDDGGAGVNSLITYTATETATHFFLVTGFGGDTGEYTLDLVIDEPGDQVSDTFEDAAPLALGEVTFGFIEATDPFVYSFAGETDTYTFEVEAGRIYTIEVAGGADYNSDYTNLPPGELDPWIFLYDSQGNLVSQNDDISFPDDISSRISFYAEESGTYFLDVQSYYPWLGGYTITTQELNPADFDPRDAINWASADNVPFDSSNTAYVYFGLAGETFGEPGPSYGWNDTEKAAVMNALEEYEKILGVNYEVTTDVNQATFRLFTTTSTQFGAYFYPQDPAFGTQQGIGAFNVNSGGWDKPGFSTQDIPGNQVSLLQGGFSFAVILHEFGHAHGLAHPHDTGGGSEVLLGVAASTGSYGIYDLNQGVYTVMSYNDAWDFHPDGPSPFTIAGIDNGWSGTLSAFDIAVLQDRYGVHSYATGNDTYILKDANDLGTYYETIWDTGGKDTIQYSGNRNARIDLLAATIDYTPTGGGVISFVDDIWGGYTIAKGVVIEDATGGGGHDALLGNSAANVLNGNGGDDFLMGRGGADKLNGGAGFDTASYLDSQSGVAASLAGANTGGDALGDVFNSIEALEGSNFNDTLTGGNAADTIWGRDGNDKITGGNKADSLYGGEGDDHITGGNDNDLIEGDGGNDTLLGENGNDTMNGGEGDDDIDGGRGNDLINGGEGDDVLTGGNDNDIFIFSDLGGFDEITDFKRGNDKVDLSDIDAIDGGADNAFSWIGSSNFNNVAGELRAYSVGSNKFVAGDTDGDGVADFVIQTNILLQQSDFLFT